MSDAIPRVSDIIEAAFPAETTPHCTINFRLLKTLIVILANQLRVIDRRVLINVDSGVKLPKAGKRPSLVVSEIKVQSEDRSAKVSKENKKSDKGKEAQQKNKNKSKENDKTKRDERQDKTEKVRSSKSMSQFNIKMDSDGSEIFENERDNVSLHAGVALHKSSEDDLEELREREIRIIKQRTDSHEEPNLSPTPMASVHSLGRPPCVNVVTIEQFNALADAVRDLESRNDPIGTPGFPENAEFLKALRRGASLTEAMAALQLSARLQAMEKAFVAMMSLLTEVAKKTPGVDVTQFKNLETQFVQGNLTDENSLKKRLTKESIRSYDWVSREEFKDAMRELREEVKNTKGSSDKQNDEKMKAVDHKAHQEAIKKIEVKMNKCIEKLNSVEVGFLSQVRHYQEYLIQMQHQLEKGLENMTDRISHIHNDPEALAEFNVRLETLQQDAENAKFDQNHLKALQNNMTLDLAKLWKEIEFLRDVKADREEVNDILRDKAGLENLNKMVTEEQFLATCVELESKIKASHNKFHDQELVWQRAIDDLTKAINEKGDWLHICKLRDDINHHLNNLKHKIDGLIDVVGEPRAAAVKKKLFENANCVSCGNHAEMNMEVPIQRLPDFKRPSAYVADDHTPKADGDHKPCVSNQPVPRDSKGHVCHRYCGGSHTLMPHLTRVPPGVTVTRISRNVTTTVGSDGKAYITDELKEMKPCEQCNIPKENLQPSQTEDDDGTHPATAGIETTTSSFDIMEEMNWMASRNVISESEN